RALCALPPFPTRRSSDLFTANYQRLYDQAGVMLRVDDDNWLKCGVEFTDGALHFSVVVTRDDQSDWSVMPLAGDPTAPVTLRLRSEEHTSELQSRENLVC